MKVPCQEGALFAVPLRSGKYAVGVVARTSPGGVMLNYFFGPARESVPTADQLSHLRPQDALLVGCVGDLHLLQGSWLIIGQLPSWKREEWPMPLFVRRDDIMKKAWLVQYSDANPNSLPTESRMDYFEADSCDRNSMWGAGAAEIRLNKLLS
jgi:hypothetical protein